ncbi:hypothetical protein IAR55_000218 [Kwoniella newhampshirensis]|uniref:Bola-like protein n=1 Tax=Kwoniella newhampshirensis TaxID=1651941 RepID=A0AAW0Z651_9TREE
MFNTLTLSIARQSVRWPTSLPAIASTSRLSSFALRSRHYSTPTPTPTLDDGEKAIYEKLRTAFPGQRLEVQDVSGGCGSFYAILISSPAFKGLSTIKQHKLVNQCLKDDIKGIHGLQLKTIPEE